MSRGELLAALDGYRKLDSDRLDEAVREGVAALLATRGRPATDAVKAALEREHRQVLAREIVFDRELRWASAVVRAQDIPLLLLKGAALLRVVYAPGERPMSDVDVLVPAVRWRDATRALLSAGARVQNVVDRPLAIPRDYALPVVTPGGVVVEVHRRVCPWPLYAVDHGALFDRASSRDSLLVPDPNDLFLTLAVHAAKHGWELPLRSFVDGRLLLRSGTLDEAAILERARAWGARRAAATWWRLVDDPVADPPQRRGPGRWWAIARTCDGPLRPLAWATRRLAYRLADGGYRWWRDQSARRSDRARA